MRLSVFSLLISFVLFYSCTPREEKVSTDSGISLRFSKDTLLFDTVFTQLRTVSKVFQVYNPSKNAIEIGSISLAGGANSPYTVHVGGQLLDKAGEINNFYLRGGDSLRVWVEATIDGRDLNNPFIVEDSIIFFTNGNRQKVILNAWGQDAYYHVNETVCDTTWTSEKPHIIVNAVYIDSGCVLDIEAGTKVYLQSYYIPSTGYRGSNIFVEGRINVKGNASFPVSFQGIREEETYRNRPGNWGAIVLLPGGVGDINYALIREGLRGIQVGLPEWQDSRDPEPANLVLQNSEIRAMEESGILAINGNINMFNSVIIDCADRNLNIQKGGNYTFVHNTFGYSGSLSFFRKPESIYITDSYFFSQSDVVTDDLNLTFVSNIVDGPNENELLLFPFESSKFLATIQYNLVKYNNTVLALDTTNVLMPIVYENLGPEQNESYSLNRMSFENALEYDFIPDDSLTYSGFSKGIRFDTILPNPCINVGNKEYRAFPPNDITRALEPFIGKDKRETVRTRGRVPDAGAFETQTNP